MRKLQEPKKRRIAKPKIALVRICKDIQECDIDEVANKIFKIGNEKKFPNLTIKWLKKKFLI